MIGLTIERVDGAFAVCQLIDMSGVDWSRDFTFLSKTDSEWSLVCREADVPTDAISRSDGWRMARVRGAMDFQVVGVLAALTSALAERGIPLFALSTYDTDYLLTKSQHFEDALRALAARGFTVAREEME